MAYRYYSTLRPLMVGGIPFPKQPGESITTIVNFEEGRTYCKDLALDRLRRCVQDALKEDLRVTDTDDRKGMLSTPGRGPSVYETAAVYSEIFRRARAGRAVAPLAVYSAAKYDETMTAARKRASVMLGL